MSYLPCENPNCKSYGKPHPNCRCHGGLADGGTVERFCSQSRNHKDDCEYFADGGMSDINKESPGFIPDEEFKPAKTEVSEPPADPQEERGYSHIPGFIPDSEFTPYEDRYSTTGQQLKTAAEGLAQGIAGPLATLAETKLLGVDPKDIVAREHANPLIHSGSEIAGLAGSMLTGVGEVGLVAKGAEVAAKAADLGKFGSSILKGAINGGLIQGSDEVSKWLLGEGDPQEPVGAALAHMGAAAVLGGGLGGIGELGATGAKKALQKIADSKFGEMAEYYLYGLASASKATTPELRSAAMKASEALPSAAKKGYLAGQKAFDQMSAKLLPPALGVAAEGYSGWKEDGVEGLLKGAGKGLVHGLIADAGMKGIRFLGSKVAAPVVLRALSEGKLTGVMGAIDHAAAIAKGSQAIDKGIDRLFGSGALVGQQALNAYYSDKDRERIEKYLDDGGVNKEIHDGLTDQEPVPAYAEGGPVKKDLGMAEENSLATHYPEQDMLLQTAKGRISNYLHALKPPDIHHGSLAFDEPPDNREQKRTYKKALNIAAKPLGILEEIKQGTVDPDQIKHFNALYPELNGLLQKRMTERIIKDQSEGKKPSFKVRQGLSMFMGTALSSDFTPQSIQAAQSVFAPAAKPQTPNQPQGQTKKSTSKLSKSDQSYLTGPQALQRRSQKV